MKTLVIHPADKTTDFLSEIYSGEDWTVIRHDLSSKMLKSLIKEHDRIIMLGHGTPQGLIGHNKFVINSKLVYLLREKELVCIWCNADKFVLAYDLSGFYTGMIISEIGEADFLGIDSSIQEINTSNKMFSFAVKNSLFKEDPIIAMKSFYISFNNRIVSYNKKNIYFRTSVRQNVKSGVKEAKLWKEDKLETINLEEFLNSIMNK